jgi:hypothetical protein
MQRMSEMVVVVDGIDDVQNYHDVESTSSTLGSLCNTQLQE